MVMVRFDSMITEKNGKEGAGYWRHDQCGQHWQQLPRPSPPPTADQRRWRMAFKYCALCWINHAWTSDEMWSWWIYSTRNPIYNKKGEYRYMTMYSAFLSVNIIRAYNDLPIRYWAPGV